MADIKFSGLPAGSTPADYNGLVAVSDVDAPFTSRKFTLTQLQEMMLENSNPRQLVLNGADYTNLITQENSNLAIQGDTTDNALYVTTDNGAEAEAVIYMGSSEMYFGHSGANNIAAPDVSSYFGGLSTSTGNVWLVESGGGQANKHIIVARNTNGNVRTTNLADNTAAVIFNARNATFNEDINNSWIGGGQGVVSDKSNYGFVQNFEVQNGKLRLVQATETTEIVDAGSVAATEQDWIEVTVGGNTGYIRVYATK